MLCCRRDRDCVVEETELEVEKEAISLALSELCGGA